MKIKTIFTISLIVSIAWVANGMSNKSPRFVASQVPQIPAENAGVTSNTPAYSRTIHENQGSICINNRTREHYKGELVGRDEVAFWASKYWSGWNLEVAIALTIKEGQRDLYCLGDDVKPYYGTNTADGRHWGESVGLYQYRTIIEATGKGGCQDKLWQLGNIERQTYCAYNDKFLPSGWQPWSAYNNGSYKGALGK